MSNQNDDVLPKRKPGSGAPTAEDLRALADQIEWLKRINWRALRQIAYHRTDDAVIGDEAVRDVYHGMLGWSVEELEGIQHPDAYARKAVIRRAIELKAPFYGTRPLSDYSDSIPDKAPSLEQQLVTRDEVIALLAELPESWREALLYTQYHGFTIEETAAKLRLTHGAVKKHVANGLKYLRIIWGVIPPDSLIKRVKRLLRLEGRGHDK